jgi:tRNA pseudouridine55 synthase
MVSAIKISGRRLHELAREGVEVERPPRRVTVSRFDVDAVTGPPDGGPHGGGPIFAVSVDCSSGTYVRSLAADLGTGLGGGAHLRRLRRTAVGPWTLDDAVALERLGPGDVLAPRAALPGLGVVTVEGERAVQVGNGRVLRRDELVPDGPVPDAGPWAVLDSNGQLLAVYEDHGDGRVKPAVVLAGS